MSSTTTPVVPRRAARRPLPPPRRRSRIRSLLRSALLLAIPLLGMVAGLLFGLVYKFSKVPLPQAAPAPQVIVFYDANGRELARVSPGENRTEIPSAKIPDTMRYAVLAAEDRDFYQHGALSWRGVFRAAWANVVRGRVAQGGSTITQQYVKNAYAGVGRQRTIFRKVREAVIAIKLERQRPKRQILDDYLNTIYFGRGAYGVEAAAKAYFNKEPNRLGVGEAALLAGLIRNPNWYANPRNARALRARRDAVLRAMQQQGWPTAALAARIPRAIATPVRLAPSRRQFGFAELGSQAYFLEKARQWLYDTFKNDPTTLNTRGLRVYTTLVPALQSQAVQAVTSVLDRPGDPPGALVALDPTSGAVLAMYGGSDFTHHPFNYAVDATTRQAGSTMKPFVLETALAQGTSLYSNFQAPAKLRVGKNTIHNFDNADHGTVSLLTATEESINTVYMQLVQQVTPRDVATFTRRTGLTETVGNEDPAHLGNPPQPSLALGANGASALQLASAFGTWADGGVHHRAFLVWQVKDAQGRVVADPGGRLLDNRHHPAPGQRVVDPNVAATVNYALQKVVEGGTGSAARLAGWPIAGKTGTTNDFKDARFVGYTPNLVASVWVGYDRDRHGQVPEMLHVHGIHVSGGTLPARIWKLFMRQALVQLNLSPVPFGQPDLGQGQVLNPTTSLPPPTLPPSTLPPSSAPPSTVPQQTTPPSSAPQPTVPQPTLPPQTVPEPPSTAPRPPPATP